VLLEGMEHVYRFRELGHVEHPEFPLGVDPDLHHARADRGHGPPIAGRQALLNAPELVAGVAPGGLRECAEVNDGAPNPSERLVGQGQYISNCMRWTVPDRDLVETSQVAAPAIMERRCSFGVIILSHTT
jgi:hypothetical protein